MSAPADRELDADCTLTPLRNPGGGHALRPGGHRVGDIDPSAAHGLVHIDQLRIPVRRRADVSEFCREQLIVGHEHFDITGEAIVTWMDAARFTWWR